HASPRRSAAARPNSWPRYATRLSCLFDRSWWPHSAGRRRLPHRPIKTMPAKQTMIASATKHITTNPRRSPFARARPAVTMSLNSLASTVPILADELHGAFRRHGRHLLGGSYGLHCNGLTASSVPLEFTQPAAVLLQGKGIR